MTTTATAETLVRDALAEAFRDGLSDSERTVEEVVADAMAVLVAQGVTFDMTEPPAPVESWSFTALERAVLGFAQHGHLRAVSNGTSGGYNLFEVKTPGARKSLAPAEVVRRLVTEGLLALDATDRRGSGSAHTVGLVLTERGREARNA